MVQDPLNTCSMSGQFLYEWKIQQKTLTNTGLAEIEILYIHSGDRRTNTHMKFALYNQIKE